MIFWPVGLPTSLFLNHVITVMMCVNVYKHMFVNTILAKTFRDDLMEEHALKYPEYGWEKNAGYPTQAHREAIKKKGIRGKKKKGQKKMSERYYQTMVTGKTCRPALANLSVVD